MYPDRELECVFKPTSVAVVGASNTPGWGLGVLSRLLSSGGRSVYPVHADAGQVLGVPAYRSVLDIPGPLDLAVIAIPYPKIPRVMTECVEKGVRAALIISGGLAERDDEGKRLEEHIVRIARRGRIRFVGPNSMGYVNTSTNLSTLAWIEEVRKGSIGLVSQSGTYGTRLLQRGLDEGAGFSVFVSSGNEADLHLEDYLEYLGQDENTRVIALYVEGLREGRRFFDLAREITPIKPIVAMKAGRTGGAARAARSHCAALAGSDAVYEAMFRQAGVIRVGGDEELFDTALALLHLPLPQGNRVGILTEGGGIGVVAADACEALGLELATFSPATMRRLDSLLPSLWSHGNPADMTDVRRTGGLVTFPCLWAIMEDGNVDAVMLMGGLGGIRLPGADQLPGKEKLERLAHARLQQEIEGVHATAQRVREMGKPLVVSRLAPQSWTGSEVFDRFRELGIPVCSDPQRAARVLYHLLWYRARSQ